VTSGFDFVLVEISLKGVTIARRTFTIRFGHSMDAPVFGGAALGLTACCAFAYRPEIDNISHVATRGRGLASSSL
jgi:hypothetical protein